MAERAIRLRRSHFDVEVAAFRADGFSRTRCPTVLRSHSTPPPAFGTVGTHYCCTPRRDRDLILRPNTASVTRA